MNLWPFSTLIRDSAVAASVEDRSAIDFSAFSDLYAPSHAGVPVTQESSVNLPVVFKCVSLYEETISSMPVDVFKKTPQGRIEYPDPAWLRQPNKYQNLAEFIAQTQVSLDLDGNCFWRKTPGPNGLLGALEVLPPSAVQPAIVIIEGVRRLVYWVTTESGREPLAQTEVVHLRGLTPPGQLRGLSPIACAKQTIGIGLAAEQFGAQFFGSGATLSGVIESPKDVTVEQAERLKVAFTKKHGGLANSHALGVLFGGAMWKPMSVNPEEAQFLATRNYTNSEIAQLYGYPASFFDSDGAKGYVTALHATLRLWHVLGLNPRLTRIENAFTSLVPRGVYMKFNRNALLQMDPAERTAFYQAAQQGEYMTRNEIRALEDMNPVDGGDEFLHSVQWQENQPEPPPPPEPDMNPNTEPAPAGSPFTEADK